MFARVCVCLHASRAYMHICRAFSMNQTAFVLHPQSLRNVLYYSTYIRILHIVSLTRALGTPNLAAWRSPDPIYTYKFTCVFKCKKLADLVGAVAENAIQYTRVAVVCVLFVRMQLCIACTASAYGVYICWATINAGLM